MTQSRPRLTQLVGADGEVVAVDLDTRFFEDEPGIEARRCDIMADEMEREAFDLVHCRLLLHHLRDNQLEAVRRMATALRPGGVLFTSECYLGAMCSSPTRAYAEMWRGFYAAMPNTAWGTRE